MAIDDRLLKLTGYDECIIGVMDSFGRESTICYDFEKIMDSLKAEGMDRAEAQEWFDFNMIGAYVGERTPVFVTRMTAKEIDETYE